MTMRTWDARLAGWLVRPLANTWVTPNHLTTLRLFIGLLAAATFASGKWPNLAALLFVLSNFVDHTDGELARITGRHSEFGHYYDLACDGIVTVSLFACIGIGLGGSELGAWAPPMGIVAGLAVAAIFHMRNEIEKRLGRSAVQQPNFAGFEAEDILYLLPLVTLFDGLVPFLMAAAIFAPVGTIIVYIQFRSMQQSGTPDDHNG